MTILGKEYEHKTMSSEPDPLQLARYIKRNFPGADYKAAYEAGFSGFGSREAEGAQRGLYCGPSG